MGARTMNLVIQKTGGKEYVSFRESFWDPVKKKTSSRTVRNFGRLDLLLAQDPEALDKLRAQAEELKKAHQESKNALLASNSQNGTTFLSNWNTSFWLLPLA